ncbi:amidohydrolase family protein [Thioalkalivibrio sp. ALJ16]|uniref:amidohydrolase family protein n=1 Tax=Thioalkalivibrio sp. ALJ16 TaxID=1158762 RepID=UPI00037433A2|nr:amidohydrolase family protein [Thioalkalivibrio sp. ALJ16]
MQTRLRPAIAAIGLVLALPFTAASATTPIFDAHLHYRPAVIETFGITDVARTLASNEVRSAIVMTPDPALIRRLQAGTDTRLVPFLEVSQRLGRKMDWMHVEDLGERIATMLDASEIRWQGLGEFHILADDRFAPGFEQLLDLAVARDLTVMIHGDPAVIDHAYATHPEVRILWAHAGSYAYPPLVRDYLERHPRMHMDLSMRNPRINPGGTIDDDWFELFLDHPDRFLIGVDTFTAHRWQQYTQLKDETRAWLRQLPEDIARAIAFENGERLFPAH